MRSESFVSFIKKVSKRLRDRIYLILDNHPSHTSKHSKMELSKLNLKLAYLPYNFPKLKRIEDELSLSQREVIANRKFKHKEELISAMKK